MKMRYWIVLIFVSILFGILLLNQSIRIKTQNPKAIPLLSENLNLTATPTPEPTKAEIPITETPLNITQQPEETPLKEETPPEKTPDKPSMGKIAGTVLNIRKEPVPDCEAIFIGTGSSFSGPFIRRGRYRDSEPYSITDASGEFLSGELPAGIYRVVFRASGYIFADNPQWIKVENGKTSGGLTQILEDGGTIFGNIKENISGKPVEGARITARITTMDYPKNYGWDSALGWHNALVVISDSQGNFLLDFLMPGHQYDLTANHSDYGSVEEKEVEVGRIRPVQFLVSPGGSAEGKVISRVEDFQVAGRLVLAWKEGHAEKGVYCATDGAFLITGLSPGDYQISLGQEPPQDSGINENVKIGYGTKISGIELVVGPYFKVSGRVIDKHTREGIPEVGLYFAGSKSTRTDEKGEFVFQNIPPGERKIQISNIPKPYMISGATVPTIWIKNSDIENIIIELSQGATVRGQVLDPFGNPLEKARITVLSTTTATQYIPLSHLSRSDGSFEITGLPPASYQLEASYPDTMATYDMGMMMEYDPATSRRTSSDYFMPGNMGSATSGERLPPQNSQLHGSAKSESFDLSAGEDKEGIILRIEAYGRISGTVKDDKGNPVSEGYSISANYLQNDPAHIETTQISDASGLYYFNQLPPGQLVIAVSIKPRPDLDWDQVRNLAGKVVTVKSGEETTGVDFIIPSKPNKGYIRGKIFTDLGKPVRDQGVRVQQISTNLQENEPQYESMRHTNQEGRFVFENLPEGKYKLFLSENDNYYSGFYFREINCPARNLMIELKRLGSIQGQVVTKETGEPLHSYFVEVLSQYAEDTWAKVKVDHLNTPDGKFFFEKIPPGEILLIIKADGYRESEQSFKVQSGEDLSEILIEMVRDDSLKQDVQD